MEQDMTNKYDRLTTLPIEDVLAEINQHIEKHPDIHSKEAKKRVDLKGHMVKLNSLRLVTFAKHGITCVECGIEGKFFAVEKFKVDEVYHINLWGINAEGEETLLTHDHIIARTLGGADNIKNTQTMCTVCNFAKGTLEQKEKQKRQEEKNQRDLERKLRRKAKKKELKALKGNKEETTSN